MDPNTTNTNPNINPPGSLVTIDPSRYIPSAADPSVPIPPGLTESTIEQSITTIHPVTAQHVVPTNFPSSDIGTAYYHAFQRVIEYLSHGFGDYVKGIPDRDDWINATTALVTNIHNSMRRTHSISPLHEVFEDLHPAERNKLQILKHALSSLSSFFTSRLTDPTQSTMCMRCLEECNIPVSFEHLDSVLMSCDQNIRAAHTTIINSIIRNMHTDLQAWADDRSEDIKNKLIEDVVNRSIDQKIFDEDTRIQAWINSHTNFIQERLKSNLSKSVPADFEPLSAWTTEAADVAYKAATAKASEIAEREARKFYEQEYNRLLSIAKQNVADDLRQQMTAADNEAETELASYKHKLRIETEQRKDNALKAANAAVKGVSRNHPRAPPVSTSLRSRTNSMSGERPSRTPSRAPSPNGPRERSTTPKATPTNTEPRPHALTEPLTDVSVGPPSNSFEVAMLQVIEPKPVLTNTPSPIPDQFTFFLNQITSQLSDISSKFEGIENRLSKVEQPRYTPSAVQFPNHPDPNYYDDMAMPLDYPDDDSNYEPPARNAATEEENFQEYLDFIYRNHYQLPDGPLPAYHQHIKNGEFDSTFTEWIHDQPHISSFQYCTIEQLNGFFNWRLGHLSAMADAEGEDKAIWTRRRDNVREAAEKDAQALAKSGRGLTGTSSFSGGVHNPPSAHPEVVTAGHGNMTRSSRSPPSARPESPNGWFTMGKGGKVQSFAKIASQAPSSRPASSSPPRSSPSQVSLPPRANSELSRPQVEAMTKAQIISLLKSRYQVTATMTRASKASVVNTFLSHQSRANPVVLVSPTPSPQQTPAAAPRAPPRARPANQAARLNTEFTVLAHPAEVVTRAKKLDPAELVRTIRTAINQAHGGGAAQVTLLSGHWSSRLNHNFVLTFAGKPTNDMVYRYRSILTAPFGTGARLIPQDGFTKVVIHSVPVERDNDGNPASTLTLIDELKRNPVCEGLTFVNPPRWFSSSIPSDKRHSSITVAFIDTDGSRVQQLIRDPPSLFGAVTRVEKYVALPILRGCDRCHALDHSVAKCSIRKGAIICPLCGDPHRARDHHVKCKGAPHNASLTCTCPPKCINCIRAGKTGKGHTALSTSCPLRKLYKTANTRTGESSEEEQPVIARMVEDPVPSSQPTADGVDAFPALPSRPSTTPSPARVDETPPPDTPFKLAVIPDAATWAASNDISETDFVSDPTHLAAYSAFVTNIMKGRIPIDRNPSTSQ